ncbi:MAG TPA: PASTA domain-containing protein [Gaiellaceae bacterium]
MRLMGVRITLGRIVTFIVLCALVSMALAFLFTRSNSTAESKRKAKVTAPPNKVVPGVVGQLYVFAESTLQEHGFGWKVVGPVKGWAGVTIASQDPISGTAVVDTGAPLVTLHLAKPKGYVTQGTPENSSPYASTEILLPAGSTTTGKSTTSAQTTTTITLSTTTPTTTSNSTTSTKTESSQARPPAFTISGAKAEPLDEIPLPERAKNLSAWLETHRVASAANERYWLFQHAWIVYGAKFGWWHGAQALETLIAVDKRVEQLWGVGVKSEAEARAALDFVHAHGG